MKKAALLLVVLLGFSCSHRVASTSLSSSSTTPTFVVSAPPALPPVTSEPPSPAPVEAPVVVPPEQHEAAGRFLQRVAYHTKVRQETRATVAQKPLAGVVGASLTTPSPIPTSLPVKPSKKPVAIRKATSGHTAISFISILLVLAVSVVGVLFEKSNHRFGA